MLWILLGIVVLVLLAAVLKTLTKPNINKEFPYRRNGPLFTPAERSFFGVLQKAVSEQVQVFGKVRVADVINPSKGLSRSEWQTAFNKIASKHFDFLLCRSDDLSVICAIELNDSSHKSQKRAERDAFLKSACQEANLPLIELPAKSTYQIEEISTKIAPYISPDKQNVISADGTIDVHSTEKMCPKCQSEMVIKIARKGQHIGKKFWACSGFPKCRYIEPDQEL